MKIKLFIIFLFSLSTQLFAESQQYVNPWPDAKLKDIEIILKENDKNFGIVKNDDGQFISRLVKQLDKVDMGQRRLAYHMVAEQARAVGMDGGSEKS